MSISKSAAQAREGARQRTGEFGEQQHTAPEMTLGGGLDLSTHTPINIDEFIAENMYEQAKVEARLSYAEHVLATAERRLADAERRIEEGKQERSESMTAYLESEIEEAEVGVQKILDASAAVRVKRLPYEREFQRRGGWSRAFLATSANGHVHSSRDCSTCNNGLAPTKFAWMTDYSGADEETIVADAGERACTSCFTSAPSDVLARPTKMFTPDEKRKQAEKITREEKRADAARKLIANGLTEDGSEFVIQTEPLEEGQALNWRNTERFKTERSAIIWATDTLSWRYGKGDARDAQRMEAVNVIAAAVAAKHDRPVEFVIGEFTVKAEMKAKRMTAGEGKKAIAALAAEHGVTL